MLVNLMAEAWLSDKPGSVPADPELLWRLAGAKSRKRFEAISAEILEKFELRDGRYFHPELTEQHGGITEVSQARRIAGLAGAASKWGDSKRMANAIGLPKQAHGYSEERKTKTQIHTENLKPGSREWEQDQQRKAAFSDSLKMLERMKKPGQTRPVALDTEDGEEG
jgi:uncharacterized protein YdaU (DUF1376 family)